MGFSAIGGAILGSLGVSFTVGSVATIAVGVVASAVVGAAIGGITAAITGGDIGSGMLFGAVGGLVVGGVAGGGIISNLGLTVGETAGGSGAVAGIGSSSIEAGTGFIAEAATSSVVQGTAAEAAKGGFLTSMFQGAGGEVVKGVGAALMPEESDPRLTEEWREDEQAHAKELAQIQADAYGGGGGGSSAQEVPYLELEEMRQAGALDQIAAQAAEDREAIQLESAAALEAQEREYSLANTNAAAEWERGMDKLRDAAGAAASGEYKSGEGAYERVLAAQQEREGTGDETALAGEQQMVA